MALIGWGRRATGFAGEGQVPFRAHVVAGVAAGVALQVILMFWFGFPEVTGRCHFGDHRGGPPPRCVDIGDGVQRDALLIVIEIEDRRAVAGADVVAWRFFVVGSWIWKKYSSRAR